MSDLVRRAFLNRILAGAVVAGASAALLPAEAGVAPVMGALAEGASPDNLVEEAAVRTTCWWRGGRRVCRRRPVRRVCWWRHGRRICAWR